MPKSLRFSKRNCRQHREDKRIGLSGARKPATIEALRMETGR
jgi:hypothetical protein